MFRQRLHMLSCVLAPLPRLGLGCLHVGLLARGAACMRFSPEKHLGCALCIRCCRTVRLCRGTADAAL
jgi:hypothetical protein